MWVIVVVLAVCVVCEGLSRSDMGSAVARDRLRGPMGRGRSGRSVAAVRPPLGTLVDVVGNGNGNGSPPPMSLLKIRTLFLLFYGTLGSCLPYFPVYYRAIGLDPDFIGLLGSITPAITFVVSPLWGALADSTGAYRGIILLTFVLSVIGRCVSIHSIFTKNILLMGLLVAVTAVLNAPVKPLMDAAIMASLTDKADYGKSRLFGQLGFGLGSFIVGPLLARNMNHMFSLHAVLSLPTALLMMTLGSGGGGGQLNNKSEDKNKDNNTETAWQVVRTSKAPAAALTPAQEARGAVQERAARAQKARLADEVRRVLLRPDVVVFFVAVFMAGLSSGIIETFAYVRILEVGGTGRDLGLCRLASSVAGGPMFWLSGAISRALGVNTIIMITFVSYVLRFMIYASASEPLHALPAEVLRGVTWAAFWACSTYHVYHIAPPGATATMLGLLNGVYGGIGQSAGALLGGYLSKRHGIGRAFVLAAHGEAAVVLLFGLYLVLNKYFVLVG